MNLTIAGAEGLPDKAFLSIRVGDTRKQSAYRPGENFHFDVQQKTRHMVVEVFEKVGSRHVSLAELSASQAKLGTEEWIQVPRNDGKQMRLGMQVQFDHAGAYQQKKANRQEASLEAKNYLDAHQVGKFLQQMVHELLKGKPQDPYEFMSGYLKQQGGTSGAQWSSETAPTVQFSSERPASGAPPSKTEEGFPSDGSGTLPDLSGHHSVVAKTLKASPRIYEQLENVRTPLGVPLAVCIKPGVDNKGHPMIKNSGLVAGDAECYSVFRELFDPVMQRFHDQLPNQQPVDFDAAHITDEALDTHGGRVLCTQVAGGRNLQGLRMLPAMTDTERCEVERVVAKACASGLQGEYNALRESSSYIPTPGGMSAEAEADLKAAGLLFEKPDSLIQVASGFARDWPEARGVFASGDRELAVWVNESDHIRILAREKSSDFKRAFTRFMTAEATLRGKLADSGYSFAESSRLGYLSADPLGVGTAMVMSADVKLPRVTVLPWFKQFCSTSLGLQARVSSAEKLQGLLMSPADGLWEISAAQKLGRSAVQQANALVRGCQTLLALEVRLEGGEEVNLKAEAEAMKGQQPADGVPAPAAAAAAPAPAAPTPNIGAAPVVPSSSVEELPRRPGLGDTDFPGFPSDVCPAEMPDVSKRHSMCAEVLRGSPSIYTQLKDKVTPGGVSFARCVKTAFDTVGHPMIRTVGAVAGDADCYDVFRDLFDPLVKGWHPRYDAAAKQLSDWDGSALAGKVDSTGRRVVSVRLNARRNLQGSRFAPACSKQDRRDIEQCITEAFSKLPTEFQGQYKPLHGSSSLPGAMSVEEESLLALEGMAFQEPDSDVLLSSGFGKNWPDARGVFVSNTRKHVVSVNEEDHLSISCIHPGDTLAEAFADMSKLHSTLEDILKQAGQPFAHKDRLGYLGCCPSDLGTCLCAGVTLRIPLLSSAKSFRSVCKSLGVRAHLGKIKDGSAAQEGIWEISNAVQLGSSEAEQAATVLKGCQALLTLETRLEQGHQLPADVKEIMTLLSLYADTLSGKDFGDMPGLGADDYPGASVATCQADMPSLTKHFSIMANVLKSDPALYATMKDLKTPGGVAFARCIKTGLDNQGHPMIKAVGCVAGDAASYDVFQPFFDAVVQKWHGNLPDAHPTDFDINKVRAEEALDPAGDYVSAVQLRLRRNLASMPMPAALQKRQRVEVEGVLVKALMSLPSDLKGDYLPLSGSQTHRLRPGGMSLAEERRLLDAGLLFQEPDSALLLSSGLGKNWPEARGVFAASTGSLAAWINEEDHLTLISRCDGGDVVAAFRSLCAAQEAVQKNLEQQGHALAHSPRLGYLTTCPSNLGSALSVEVTLKLPSLAAQAGFRKLCKRLKLATRSAVAKDVDSEPLTVVSNMERLGSSEVEQLNTVIGGVRALLNAEAELKKGSEVDLEAIQLVL
eukprot:TRINITY_DN112544_c0_g1_i1.p1 TRINITY_DN112544_c0_g1~~TRINITY_DN112544_c0_g1_i1.p1  ORF type:complete len:1423 (-),score=292.96 TRINITY_DN112544_c0_g1_i1:132-4400(-)